MKPFNPQMREKIRLQAIGKKVKDLTYESEMQYWVMEFDDGSEISFRFMAELL